MRDADSQSIGRQVRGSSLLLAGRVLCKFINFGVQVAIVRLLTRDDYGAFAYGLALIVVGELLVKLGLRRGATRFVPYYYERGEPHYLLGTLGLVVGAIVGLGLLGFGLLNWVADLDGAGFPSGEGGRVVLILVVLAPVQALDAICLQTLACVSEPRRNFFRKHVLGPALRVAAIATAFLLGGSSDTLAYAYLASGFAGLAFCLHVTLRELRVQGVLPLPYEQWRVPWRPLLGFSLPQSHSPGSRLCCS